MRIIFIADVRLPTEKGHGIQIMETCAALVRVGHELTLFIASRDSADPETIFKHYDIKERFPIKKVPSINLLRLGKIGFYVQSRYFAKQAASMLQVQGGTSDIIYTRDESTSHLLPEYGHKVIYEMHDVRKSKQQLYALKKVTGIVTISKGLADYCIANGIQREKIVVAPDAVSLEKFTVKESKEECRRKLGLPTDKKIALYTGHLYSWKGVDVLTEAAKTLGNGIEVLIINGKPHEDMPYYLKAADVLVLPNSAKTDISRLYTSPLKLFEYMASGTPIVASDLPSIREILNENNAVFAKPDDPKSFADAIKYVLENPAKADILSRHALSDVQNYTWDKRAERIFESLKRFKI